jgi:hypothetical protein
MQAYFSISKIDVSFYLQQIEVVFQLLFGVGVGVWGVLD